MGIYSNEIENILQSIPVKNNILHEYDNYTYHIQLFMVPVDVYKQYCLLKSALGSNEEKNKNLEALLKRNKIIIAESGVSNTININNLNIESIPPTSEESCGSTIVKMDLDIDEINGSSLMNKIALASYTCGYESYMYQPFFISIWFTGYKNQNGVGNPTAKIPINENYDVCTYNVIMTVSSSVIEGNKTSYKMKLYPMFYNALSKEFNIVNNLGEIESSTVCSFKDYIKEIEKKINEKLQYQYQENVIKNVYGGRWPLKIILDENLQEFKSEEAINHEEYRKLTYGDPISSLVSMGDYYEHKVKITPQPNDTIQTLLRQASYAYHKSLKGEMITIEYNPLYLDSYNDRPYFAHIVKITTKYVPGLQEYTEDVQKTNESLKEKNKSNKIKIQKNYATSQLDYLNSLQEHNLIQKRYKWLLNGENIDVLSIKRNEDNLWYMNSGLTNLYYIDQNTVKDTYYINSIDKDKIDDIYDTNVNYKYKSEIQSLRNSRGEINIDDLYNLITNEKDKNIALSSWFRTAYSNEPLNTIQSTLGENEDYQDTFFKSQKEKDEQKAQIVNMIGMSNIFQWGGQRLTLDMDIIGDPFWLFFGSEYMNLAEDYLSLPHIILCLKSFYSNDGMDEYKEDKLMELNTVYMITKIVSTFSNGKFTQKLEGFIATPFIHSSIGDSASTEFIDEERVSTTRSKTIVNDDSAQMSVIQDKTQAFFAGNL